MLVRRGLRSQTKMRLLKCSKSMKEFLVFAKDFADLILWTISTYRWESSISSPPQTVSCKFQLHPMGRKCCVANFILCDQLRVTKLQSHASKFCSLKIYITCKRALG